MTVDSASVPHVRVAAEKEAVRGFKTGGLFSRQMKKRGEKIDRHREIQT